MNLPQRRTRKFTSPCYSTSPTPPSPSLPHSQSTQPVCCKHFLAVQMRRMVYLSCRRGIAEEMHWAFHCPQCDVAYCRQRNEVWFSICDSSQTDYVANVVLSANSSFPCSHSDFSTNIVSVALSGTHQPK